jgi:hypothetical protein
MKLLTKEIQEKATKQYDKGSDMEQMVVAKYFGGSWTWYLMNLDPEDNDYAWGIVDGHAVEMGSWQMSELQKVKIKPFGLPIERDLYFKPMKAKDVWEQLNKGEWV